MNTDLALRFRKPGKWLVLGVILSAASPHTAVSQIVELQYSAVWSGSGVTATGAITFNSNINTYNPGDYLSSISGIISSLSITVTGDSNPAYNGTFGISDYSDVNWDTGGSTLNSSLGDLKPQFGSGGEFGLIGYGINAPESDPLQLPFTITTGGGVGTTLTLQSLSPVPEPEEWAAIASTGLLAFAIWHRRSRKASKA